MRVCAVIPAYNEENHIGPVIEGVKPFVQTVLVVDDGSRDRTGEIARAAGAEVLTHNPNQGKGISLRDGLSWGVDHGFDAMIALDADGQHLPAELPRFVTALQGGADLVVGNRMDDVATMPWVRKATNRFMSWLVSRLARTGIPDTQCGYRGMTAGAWASLSRACDTGGFDFESDMLIQAGRMGMRLASVPISTIYGTEVSKIDPVADTIRFFRMVGRKWRMADPEPYRRPRSMH